MFDDVFPSTQRSAFRFTTLDSFPKLNIKKRNQDGKTSLIIQAALAGYKKEDITIKVDRNILEISCEKQEKDSDEYFISEISARSFSRKIALGDKFDTGSPSVTFIDGLLEITFQEDPEKAPKFLKIA
jgi:HSP20 family protein